MWQIYTLSEKDSTDIKYVGITKQKLNDRLLKHISSSKNFSCKRTYKDNWIYSTIKRGSSIVIKCIDLSDSKDDAYLKEKYWIKFYINSGAKLTNLSDGGEGFTGKIREKISKRQAKKRNHVIATSKKVYQFSIEGKYVNCYDSIKLASIATNTISNNIHKVISGERREAGGYYWSLVNKFNIKEKKDNSVFQFTEDGKLVKKWNSVLAAAKFLDIPPQTIIMAINSYRGRKSSGGFLWSRTGKIKKVKIRHTKGINQYALDGSFIKYWSTIKDAAVFYNISKGTIGDCARGINKTSAGYIWKFNKV